MSRRNRSRVMYMHTLNGRPASYEPGYQVHFVGAGRYARKGARLLGSVAEVRREQKASRAWRVARGYDPDFFEYGFARVEVPV